MTDGDNMTDNIVHFTTTRRVESSAPLPPDLALDMILRDAEPLLRARRERDAYRAAYHKLSRRAAEATVDLAAGRAPNIVRLFLCEALDDAREMVGKLEGDR
jgi:hypothetical protein